jgi:hypothetical protein
LLGNANRLRGDDRRCYDDWRCHVNHRPDNSMNDWRVVDGIVTIVTARVTTVTATAATGETGVGCDEDGCESE